MKIEQVLHGYSNGHTLLRSSVKSLTVNDAAKMDVLSDWSGYQDDREDSSYITTYPLVDSPYYVVANHGMPMRWIDLVVSGLIHF